MRPEELTARRKALGYGPVDFAKAVGVYYQTVWRWESGRCPIPAMVGKLLTCLENRNRENEA